MDRHYKDPLPRSAKDFALALTVASPMGGNLAEAIRRRFGASGGLELELPRRDSIRQVPGVHE